MLYDAAENPGELSPAALRAAYFEELTAVITELGIDTVVGGTGLDRSTIGAIADGETPELTIEEAAEILALGEGTPSSEDIAWEARDHLLIGMTSAVLDVDTIARESDVELDAKEIQQAIEGRLRTTLAQLAEIQAFIDDRR
ncbi:MAG: DUF5791 family protein [Halolamina sp.]|uniref:DUF5791 family protein n=1 Tax=Halolamina sp. TaxID=1940283 RepID=UPI002FC2C64C